MNATLVCKGSKRGVLDMSDGHIHFYPSHIPEAEGELGEDEIFLHYCMCGTRRMTPSERREMGPEALQQIDELNKRALTVIVKLKIQIANIWSRRMLKPFMGRPISKTETISDLIIDDIRDLQLDIVIPRPVLINALVRLKKTCALNLPKPCYVRQKAYA